MYGLMQNFPLTLPPVFDRAERLFGRKQLVGGTAAGRDRPPSPSGRTGPPPGRRARRARRSPGGRVGTFAWNTARHLGLYLAAPCTGRVLHTLNIRLSRTS